MSHHLMIVALIYATVVFRMRPTRQSLLRTFVALNLFFLAAIPVNLILKVNHFWIYGEPDVPSLLDYMGPHPWYILSGEVAVLHFLVAYTPFYLINGRNSRLQYVLSGSVRSDAAHFEGEQ